MRRISGGLLESTGWASNGRVQHYVETVTYPRLTRTEMPCGSNLPDGYLIFPKPHEGIRPCHKPACLSAFDKAVRADA